MPTDTSGNIKNIWMVSDEYADMPGSLQEAGRQEAGGDVQGEWTRMRTSILLRGSKQIQATGQRKELSGKERQWKIRIL